LGWKRFWLIWIIQIVCRNPSLGLATKAKGSQGCGPRRVWEGRLTLPSEFSFWELESRRTPELSASDCRCQNTLHWRVLSIIGKLLKFRCLKWVRMTCLDICNTSYGKKKGRESNWQFDSRPQKVGNWPKFHACRWSAIHSFHISIRAITLLQISSGLEVWEISYGLAKLWESNFSSFETPLWEFRDKKAIWMWASRRGAKNTIWGKVVVSLEFGPWWVLWVQSHLWLVLAPKVLQHRTNQLVVGWM
jgi:hypothetical protein